MVISLLSSQLFEVNNIDVNETTLDRLKDFNQRLKNSNQNIEVNVKKINDRRNQLLGLNDDSDGTYYENEEKYGNEKIQ